MTWQLLITISIISGVATSILQKFILKNKAFSALAFTAIFEILVGSVIGIVLLFKGFRFENFVHVYPNLILMVIVYVLANLSKYTAIKRIEISTFTILFQFSAFITVLFSILILREPFSLLQFLGLILIISAITLVTIKNNRLDLSFNRGMAIALASAFIFGVAFANDAYILRTNDVLTFTFLAFMIPGVILALAQIKQIKPIVKVVTNRKVYPILIFTAILYAIGTIAVYAAYQNARNAGQIISLNQMTTILVVLTAAILLREKKSIAKKILAAIMSAIGVILLM